MTLTLNDRLLAVYIFYGSILMLKTFLISILTERQRYKNKHSQRLASAPPFDPSKNGGCS